MTINATLCYLRRNGRTLMLFRNKKPADIHKSKWNGLGGKMEPGESPEECAVREIHEESGLVAVDPRMRGILTFPRFDGANDWIVFVFTVENFRGSMHASPEGELKWIEDVDLADLPLWEGDRIFLPLLNQERFFSGKFIYRSGRLTDHVVVFHPADS
ncbi:8-oxo-dGTP diphosphatase [bacterium]|nr:8-oxo-dGTP diphosphatase [candidate division CSSED10-310 bacterium]